MKTRGISLNFNIINSCHFANIKIVGTLTHEDYQLILPTLEAFMKNLNGNKINAFVDITEFEEFELQAAWDDFKFGMKYNKEFGKIAILGQNTLQEVLSKISNWFTYGEIKYFEDREEALIWLEECA